jgi:hypothetical protein
MTRKMLVIALALTVFGVLGSAFADDIPCNNHILYGSYGFTIEGTKLAGTGPVGAQKGVAMAHFTTVPVWLKLPSPVAKPPHRAQKAQLLIQWETAKCGE